MDDGRLYDWLKADKVQRPVQRAELNRNIGIDCAVWRDGNRRCAYVDRRCTSATPRQACGPRTPARVRSRAA